jgi:hypothetical protein
MDNKLGIPETQISRKSICFGEKLPSFKLDETEHLKFIGEHYRKQIVTLFPSYMTMLMFKKALYLFLPLATALLKCFKFP